MKSDKQMKKVFLKIFFCGRPGKLHIYLYAERKDSGSFHNENIINSLPEESFIQTHRSYIVNVNHVNLVEGNVLNVAGHEIPVARNCRDAVLPV